MLLRRPKPDPVLPGQRSVWDFPRPPAVEPEQQHLRVVVAGRTVASTNRAVKALETSHPPVYYFPPSDVDHGLLREQQRDVTTCEWKGSATYFDIIIPPQGSAPAEAASTPARPAAAFCYKDPTDTFKDHAGWLAFYAARVDEAWVGDHRATPQPGDFYAGWITPGYAGPFKGGPGSWGW